MFCVILISFQDLIPATNGPLDIFVDIFIFEVSKINDIELTMTFELYFDLMWEESRFVINETSEKWGQVTYLFYALKLLPCAVNCIKFKITFCPVV